MNDVKDQFHEAIRAAGLHPPEEIVADGTLHRFSSSGKRGDTAGWYVLHPDRIPAGRFGCWRNDVKEKWKATGPGPMSESERQQQRTRVAAAQQLRDADKDTRQADAAVEAQRLWAAADPPEATHPYLIRKGVKACGVRQMGATLVVPMRTGEHLHSLQFIEADGAKRFLTGGRVEGGYFLMGIVEGAQVLCIAEGFATGATIHEATRYPVAVAFNCGNLLPAVQVLRTQYPDVAIIVCADNDAKTENNPGLTHAMEAARSVRARVAVPVLESDPLDGVTDFNDLGVQRGQESVMQAITAAEEPETISVQSEDWPSLIPLDASDLPGLEPTLLPTWAGDFAASLAASTETPAELAIGLTLATCATAAARRVRVVVKPGYEEPCNLWIAPALPSGNRKSAVEAAATAPLSAWERDEGAMLKSDILRLSSERKTLEARVKELRNRSAKEKDMASARSYAKEAADIEADLPEVPRDPQLWTSDSTPERMGTLLAGNGERIAWLSSEGGIFDLLQGRYSSGILNLDLVLKAWSGDAERVDRSGRPSVHLQQPLLTIGLSPQPEVLRGLAKMPGFRGRGLLARFLYLLPPSPLGYRSLDTVPMQAGVRSAYSSGVRAMLNWPIETDEHGQEQLHLLRLEPSAYDEWLDFARQMESMMRPGGDFEYASDWAGKAPGTAARLAGILHGIRYVHQPPWAVEIEKQTMINAREIMVVIARHSLTALEWMGADGSVAAARRVWQWVERERRARFTIRDGHQALKGTFARVHGIRHAFEVLEERGYVKIDAPQKGKRGNPPSPTVRVRSDIAETWA